MKVAFMSSKLAAAFLAFLLVAAVLSVNCLAQTETGSISGTVRDPTGAVVSGAKVSLRSETNGLTRDTTTNSSGIYIFPSLRPDTYVVTIEATGFEKYVRRLDVVVASANDVSAQLIVGAAATTIEVNATGEVVTVNTENSTLGQTVTSQQVTELPTLTRNPYDLVGTSGSVSEDVTSGRGAGYAINGQRSASTDILLDGGENVDLFTATVGQSVPLESVQEFGVMTDNFSAEFGRAGGGVVNVVTKSGTNSFHGTVYEFNRVSALAANTYNNNANQVPKAGFTRNQFGYSFGGPIKKDKLFFFSSTEWTRIRSNGASFWDVTDPSFLQLSQISSTTTAFFNAYGAFRPNLNFVGAPITWGTATGQTGTTCSFGIACSQAFADVVSYNVPSDAGGGAPQNTYSSVARVDYNLSNKTSLFGRFALYNDVFPVGVVNNSPYAGYDTGQSDRNQNWDANLSHVFSSNLVSTSKVIYNRLNEEQPLGTAPLTPGLFSTAAVPALPTTNFQYVMPGYVQNSTANALPFGGPQNLYQFFEDVSWSKGKHQFKFGGNYIHVRDNRVFGAYENAVQILGQSLGDGLSNLVTGQTYQFEVAVNPQGNYPCKKDITGAYTVDAACEMTLPANSPSFKRNYHYNDGAFYGQDSWKITPRLTLNGGLRWEYFGVQHNANPALDSNFYLGSGATIFDQIRNGSVSQTGKSSVGGFWNPRYKNFAPRVGFAWDIFGDGKTSLRGGWGISYERDFNNVTYNTIQNPPQYAVVSVYGEGLDVATQPVYSANLGPLAGSAGSTCGTTGVVGPGTSCIPNVTLRAPNQNLKTAYAENWSLSIDRELAARTVFSLEYTGSHGVHLYDIGNINVPYYGSTYEGDARLANRLNFQYGNVNYRGSQAYSLYHGLNAKLTSTNLKNSGVTLSANYTYSHSIDVLSSTFSDGYWGNYWLGYTDYFNPNIDRGNSDFDLRHRVSLSAVWDVPLAKHSSSALTRAALGGWEFSPIFLAHTGYPFTIFDCWQGVTICSRWSPAGGAYATTGHSTGGAGNVFTYIPLSYNSSAPACPSYWPGCNIEGAGDSLQVPNQSIFCNSVVGGSPFTCSGVPMIGRNPFRGPGYYNINMLIAKSFKLTERFSMQFRGEMYDMTNHHNQYVVGSNLDISGMASSGPGANPAITSGKGCSGGVCGAPTDERRNVQFAVKLIF